MKYSDKILNCSSTSDGVEIVTARVDDSYITTIHNGALDGDRFVTDADPDGQHDRACLLVRMASWKNQSTSRARGSRRRRGLGAT